jgi:hypothetical protein
MHPCRPYRCDAFSIRLFFAWHSGGRGRSKQNGPYSWLLYGNEATQPEDRLFDKMAAPTAMSMASRTFTGMLR